MPKDKDAKREAARAGYTSLLKLVNGLACNIEGCDWKGGVGSEKKHNGAHKEEPSPTYRHAYVQSFFEGQNNEYFEVIPPKGATGSAPTPADTLELVVETYMRDMAKKALRAPVGLEQQQLTKWDEKAKWYKVHEGRVMPELAVLSGIGRPDDLPAVKMALEALEHLFTEWYEGLEDVSDHIRQIFASVSLADLDGAPLKAILASFL
jgi:hypothetical protein